MFYERKVNKFVCSCEEKSLTFFFKKNEKGVKKKKSSAK
jgi:hypothetical protein